VTDNFVVMAIYGSSLNEMCVMGGMTNAWEGVNSCFQWEEGAKTRVLVVDHGTGELWKDEELDESFFSFHHVNAYEEDGKVVLDLIAGSDSSIIQSVVFQNEVMMDKEQRDSYKDEIEPTVLKRVVLEKKRGAASVVTTIGVAGSEDGNSYGFDFPLVNPLVRGRKHCFVYGASGPFAGGADEYEAQALVKVNLCEGDLGGGVQAQVLAFPGHALAGDMSFVPDDREGADEDDGVILQVMLDGENTESYLRVIDAKTMDTVATIYNERDQDKFIAPCTFHPNH
jgi:carotenoid cleavage dioxygenase-like enzyme